MMEEINFDRMVDECSRISTKFDNAERYVGLREIMDNPAFHRAKHKLDKYGQVLESKRQILQNIFHDREFILNAAKTLTVQEHKISEMVRNNSCLRY